MGDCLGSPRSAEMFTVAASLTSPLSHSSFLFVKRQIFPLKPECLLAHCSALLYQGVQDSAGEELRLGPNAQNSALQPTS